VAAKNSASKQAEHSNRFSLSQFHICSSVIKPHEIDSKDDLMPSIFHKSAATCHILSMVTLNLSLILVRIMN